VGRRRLTRAALRAAVPLALLAGCADFGDEAGPAGPAAAPTWSADVRPLLQTQCAVCHTPGFASGGLDLGSYAGVLAGGDGGPAVVAGDAGASPLVERLETDDTARRMPLGGQLSAPQIATVRQWIDAGALED